MKLQIIQGSSCFLAVPATLPDDYQALTVRKGGEACAQATR